MPNWCSSPCSATLKDAARVKIWRPCWMAGGLGVAGPEKIRVQRVRQAVLHGGAGGQQRLRQHLTAKHPAGADVPAVAAKQVDLQCLQLHQAEQFLEGFRLPVHGLRREAPRLASTLRS
jgi:hypothetical protein